MEPLLVDLVGHQLGGVALGHRPHVQGHPRLLQKDGAGVFVNDHLVQLGKLIRLLQRLHGGVSVGGVLRQGHAGVPLPVAVPQLQGRTHGDVHPAAAALALVLGKG